MIILKILLIILLTLFALLFFVLFLNIVIKAYFVDELSLEVRILFFRLRILPQKQKKDIKIKKEKKPKKNNKDKSENKSRIKDIFKEKGLSGFLTMLKALIGITSSNLIYLLSKFKVKKVSVMLLYAGKDAADTAIGYGKCCAVVYPAVSIIAERTKCKTYEAEVRPNFTEGAKTEISAFIICKIRIIHILVTAVKFLTDYIKLKIKGIV